MTPTPCTSLHMRMQSPQRMHLFGSRPMQTEDSSFSSLAFVLAKRTLRMPKRSASSCSWQLSVFSQIVQSRSWEARSSSRIIRRCFSSLEVLVRIFKPSLGSMEQEASILPFSSSTTHMRQAP